MGVLKDILPVLKKHKIVFVERKPEVSNIVSFYFKSIESVSWKAGQHGIFSFFEKLKGGSWRGFSIASSPKDDKIMISTRITDKPSAFKKALMALKPGDQMKMRGPFGPLYLDGTNRPVVFIAGGIGITPYRALIQHIANHENVAPERIELLYADNKAEYAFKDEFDSLPSNLDYINIDYTSRPNLHEKLSDLVTKYGNNANYYISGSYEMVSSIKKVLRLRGIYRKNIMNDIFIGLK